MQKRLSRAEERRRQQIHSLLQGFCLGLCICLLGFGIWKLASIFLKDRSGEKEYERLREYVLQEPVPPAEAGGGEQGTDEASKGQASGPAARVDLPSLQEINSDAVGWVEIPDTAISYPLVHTDNNAYYLDHTFRREENKTGSIFVEASNKADFSNLHTIVYGHDRKDGFMFAGLEDYSKKSFYEDHPYVYVDLPDGSHCYEIFSCHEAEVADITYTIGYAADDIYASFLESIKASSLYDTGVEASVEDSVITLSTCTDNGKKRFVVHARKVY